MLSAPPPHLSPLYLMSVSPPPPSPPSPPSLLLVGVVFACNSPAAAFAMRANHQHGNWLAIALTRHAGDSPTIALATLPSRQIARCRPCHACRRLARRCSLRCSDSPVVTLPRAPATCPNTRSHDKFLLYWHQRCRYSKICQF